jgi:hypothetical protein
VLTTSAGALILGPGIPKTIPEIEEACGQNAEAFIKALSFCVFES